MCSVNEDIEDITKYPLMLRNKAFNDNRNLLKCKKCDSKSTVLLQKKDPFCRQCFFEYCSHKFRSTIGKSKKIKHGDKVLLACSGGRKSTALLHLTKDALDSATSKQLSFLPEILFIDDSVLAPLTDDGVYDVLNELKSFGYPVLCSSLEMVLNLNGNQNLFWNFDSVDSPICSDSRNRIQECLSYMSLSAKLDIIKHIRLLLIAEVANRGGFKYVFLGDTSCSLAENILTDINLGRGSQISSDTNFCDTRYKVPICRPLREFSNKEVALYLHSQDSSCTVLPDLLTKTDSKSSIQRLTESFITNLREDFPATIFTIFRIGGKLSLQDGLLESELCFICMSKLDNIEPDSCSALEALNFSKNLSYNSDDAAGKYAPDAVSNGISLSKSSRIETKNIFKLLCHGCSVAFRSDKENSEFNAFFKQMKRNEMKEEIKDFFVSLENEPS